MPEICSAAKQNDGGHIPVRHWKFNDLCNLLRLDGTPIYTLEYSPQQMDTFFSFLLLETSSYFVWVSSVAAVTVLSYFSMIVVSGR